MKRSSVIIASVVAVAVALGVAAILPSLSSPNEQVGSTNNIRSMVEKFSSPIQVASASDEISSHAPAVAVDPETDVMYVAYVENPGGAKSTQYGGIGIGDLYIKSSTDGGKTFSDPVRVNDRGRCLSRS